MENYRLIASLRSPFARRIRTALARLNLNHTVEFVDVFQHNDFLLRANPLGLVPTLITPDVGPISDSAAILEYINDRTKKIWPASLSDRALARQASTLCQGVMQSTVNFFIETRLHSVPEPKWAQDYQSSVLDTLTFLSALPESTWIREGFLTQAAWDLGVAIEYAMLRMPHLNLESKFPGLMTVVGRCREHGLFTESAPPA